MRTLVSAACTALLLCLVAAAGGEKEETGEKTSRLRVPLTDATGIRISGKHRFIEVAGLTGYNPLSLKTRALVATHLPRGEAGTLSVWASPLEDLDINRFVHARLPDKDLLNYPLVSDADTPWKVTEAGFALYWKTSFPPVMARFQSGKCWDTMAYGRGAWTYAEDLPLRKGCWYHFVMTWDRKAKETALYVNGVTVGRNDRADGFGRAGGEINIGNPMMVVRELTMRDSAMSAAEIAKLFEAGRPAKKEAIDERVRERHAVRDLPPLDVKRDDTWKQAYSCPFRKPEDLEGWKQQTGPRYRGQFTVKTTDEGLLFQTPDTIDYDSRMNLWCPKAFEGDIWVEFDFRPEGAEGLALVMIHASGVQREDITEHGLVDVGAMWPMMSRYRNYHWEYMRRVPFMRKDVETQYFHKNPMMRLLAYGVIPRLERNRWHRLRLVRLGRRLHGSIGGRTVFDVTDSPEDNNGPVYGAGRLALRQMYRTKMRYRDLTVWTRPDREARSPSGPTNH